METPIHAYRRIAEGGPPRDPFASKLVRSALGAVLLFAALSAFGGGYYGLSGAENAPLHGLEAAPFKDSSVPSLLFLVAVGGSLLLAGIAVFSRWRSDQALSVLAGTLLLLWLVVQVARVGRVSWMQPAAGFMALAILLLAWVLLEPESENQPHPSGPRRRDLVGQH